METILEKKTKTHAKMPMKRRCQYCGSSHLPRRCLANGKKCRVQLDQPGHRGLQKQKNITIHDLKQEPDQYHEEVNHIDMVNIYSIYFNNKHSVITSNLKISSNQVSTTVPYKVDTGSDGNIMSLHIYKNLFPMATKDQLTATKNDNIQFINIQQNSSNTNVHVQGKITT